jgi:hypothetical protein
MIESEFFMRSCFSCSVFHTFMYRKRYRTFHFHAGRLQLFVFFCLLSGMIVSRQEKWRRGDV